MLFIPIHGINESERCNISQNCIFALILKSDTETKKSKYLHIYNIVRIRAR